MQQLSENYTLINRIKKAGIYIVLILISLLVLLPLVFLLLNSFKSQAEIIRIHYHCQDMLLLNILRMHLRQFILGVH